MIFLWFGEDGNVAEPVAAETEDAKIIFYRL